MSGVQARILVLMVFASALVSCAAAEPAAKHAPAPASQRSVESERAAETSAEPQPSTDEAEDGSSGPIDLGLGEDEGEEEIVIERPRTAAELADEIEGDEALDEDEEDEEGGYGEDVFADDNEQNEQEDQNEQEEQTNQEE